MKEKHPKVSICVPVYNVEKYIEKCARSLFEQTLEDIEYIFVSDCSPDRSFDVLRKVIEDYPHRKPHIKLMEHERNFGPGVARQTAAALATGEYIYFPDSDDWVELEMMEELYEKGRREDADILVFRYVSHTSSGDTYSESLPFNSRDEWMRCLFQQRKAISLWQRFIKNTLYRKAEAGEDKEGLIRFEDYFLVLKLHYYSLKVLFIDKIYYHYNDLNSESVTSSFSPQAADSGIRVGKMIEEFIRNERCYDIYKYEVESLKQIFANTYLSVTFWNPRRYLELSANIDRRYVKDYNRTATLKQCVLAYLISNNHFVLAQSLTKICRCLRTFSLKDSIL